MLPFWQDSWAILEGILSFTRFRLRFSCRRPTRYTLDINRYTYKYVYVERYFRFCHDEIHESPWIWQAKTRKNLIMWKGNQRWYKATAAPAAVNQFHFSAATFRFFSLDFLFRNHLRIFNFSAQFQCNYAVLNYPMILFCQHAEFADLTLLAIICCSRKKWWFTLAVLCCRQLGGHLAPFPVAALIPTIIKCQSYTIPQLLAGK